MWVCAGTPFETCAFSIWFGKTVIIYPRPTPPMVDIKTFHRNNKPAEKSWSMPIYRYMYMYMYGCNFLDRFLHSCNTSAIPLRAASKNLLGYNLPVRPPLHIHTYFIVFSPKGLFRNNHYLQGLYVTNFNTQLSTNYNAQLITDYNTI